MRNYRTDVSSEKRVIYGRELTLALAEDPETKALGQAMGVVQAELEEAVALSADAEIGLMKERVKLRFAERRLEGAIRTLHRRAGVADGGRVGPVSEALFPDGLVAETAPIGERQEKRVRALVIRLEALKLTGADAMRAESMAALGAAVTDFAQARGRDEAARQRVAALFTTELVVRDAHRTQVERVLGQLRVLFPNDRARRELFVPTFEAPTKAKDEDEEPTGG